MCEYTDVREELRVVHFPQIPCEPFIVKVESLPEALKVINMLADYDMFQYRNNIKPDYANMTDLEVYCVECEDWIPWEVEVQDEAGNFLMTFDNHSLEEYLRWVKMHGFELQESVGGIAKYDMRKFREVK